MSMTGFGAYNPGKKCASGCGSRPVPASPFSSQLRGMGVSPDGLGSDETPPLARTVTGNSLFDTLVGAAAGYAMSSSPKTDFVYAGAGAAALGFLGLPGLLGLVALGLVKKQSAKKKNSSNSDDE